MNLDFQCVDKIINVINRKISPEIKLEIVRELEVFYKNFDRYFYDLIIVNTDEHKQRDFFLFLGAQGGRAIINQNTPIVIVDAIKEFWNLDKNGNLVYCIHDKGGQCDVVDIIKNILQRQEENLASIRCLVVDNERPVRELFGKILKEEIVGCVVHYASNIKDSISLTKKHHYDIICADIDMSIMSGQSLGEIFEISLNGRRKVLMASPGALEKNSSCNDKNNRVIIRSLIKSTLG